MTVAQSIAVYGDDVSFTRGKLTATATGTIVWSLGVSNSNDGTGITWETVTNGSWHTFSASGKWLYWKASSSDGSITDIRVEVDY